MQTYAIPSQLLRKRAMVIGLPSKLVEDTLQIYLKWTSASGHEWTVGRFKSIKQDILRSVAGETTLETQWVSRSRINFRGVFGQLQKLAHQGRKMLRKVLTLLNIYTVSISSDLMKSQLEKFSLAVQSPGLPVPDSYFELIRSASLCFREIHLMDIPGPLIIAPPMVKQREERLLPEVLTFFNSRVGIEFKTKFPVIHESMVSLWGTERGLNNQAIGGVIGITQEPGLKARFYASPSLWIQHVLKPLGDTLYDILRGFSWDCTFDQTRAIPYVQRTLAAGKKTWSFDLSSATDRFPFDLQLETLRTLIPMYPRSDAMQFVDLFEKCAKLPFKMPDGTLIQWMRGQPLGMYPSFASFAITHGLLLFGLNNNKHQNKFFVLGDDVIILDEQLALKYAQALGDLDIPYSPFKTIISSTFGEFAGKVITEKSVIPQLKWRPISDDNILDVIGQWGIEAISLCPTKFAKFVRRVVELPEPYGFGFNPEGKSFEERIKGFSGLFDDEKMEFSYVTSYRALVLQRLKFLSYREYSSLFQDGIRLSDIRDQRISETVRSVMGPRFQKLSKLLGKNMYTIDPSLHLSLDVPKQKTNRSQGKLKHWFQRFPDVN